MGYEEFLTFQYLMERLDTVYIQWVQKKADEGTGNG